MDQAGGLMAKVDLPYVQRFKDRHGKVRHYFRKPGHKRVTLPGDPWSREFIAAYQTAMAKREKRPIGASKVAPGTFEALLVEFYGSAQWAGLKENTQANYRNILERLRDDYGHNPVRAILRADIDRMMDERGTTPGAARSLLKRLRTLLDFAVKRGYLEVNPARTADMPQVHSDGFRAWTEDDIARFERHHPPGSRARLALALLLYTGQRRSDVVTMGWQHVQGGKMHVLQMKGRKGKPRVRLAIPLHPTLSAALAEIPRTNMTFLMTAYNKPMTPAGFTQWFVEMAKAAGLPERSGPHGLRKAAARRLAEAGASALQIAAITGHQTLAEVARYTASAEQERLAEGAMAMLSGANGERKMSNLGEPIVKPSRKRLIK